MPLALLLSPDDQAVSAITAVLEEMSVTCERPLDGVSAAQKLNSNRFDLVLVDCENLPAAKLIFDVCRRGKNGNNPVPIAIVDGRAGLPTAFRLGAELILTKPVAKDQARTTIRTAVGRVRKEEPVRTESSEQFEAIPNSPAIIASTVMPPSFAETATQAVPGEHALAASAAGVSSPLTSFSEPPSIMASAAPAPAMKPAAAIAELDSKPVAKALIAHDTKADLPEELSEDPVMVELDRAESVPETKTEAPVFSSYPEKERRERNGSRGPLVALLVLVLAGAGSYFAWMYQPGFRALAQPQVDRVLALIGMPRAAQTPTPTPAPAKPVAQPTPTPATVNAPDAAQTSAAPATDGTQTATTPATAGGAASSPVQVSATSVTPVPAAVSPAVDAPSKPALTKTEPEKIPVNQSAPNQSATSSNAAGKGVPSETSDAELPGEKTAIILSSKGAEKRLMHSVQPTYPAGAHLTGSEGTMVLKAVVDENGKVEGARVVEGNTALAKVAINAVKQWRYRPYMRDGKALPFQTIVLVDFQRQ